MTNPIYKEIEYNGIETTEKLGFKIIKEIYVEKTYKFGYLIKETNFRRTAEVNGHYENKNVPQQYECINSSLYSEEIDSLEEASERISTELGNLKYIARYRHWTDKEYLKFIELRRALGKNRWQIRQLLSPESGKINNYFLELWAEQSGLKYETIKDLAGLEFN
jgi:hypothetical protein